MLLMIETCKVFKSQVFVSSQSLTRLYALDWIFNRVNPLNPGARPSVVSWSLTCVDDFGVGVVNDGIDYAIQQVSHHDHQSNFRVANPTLPIQLINAGIHVVVAAGNGNEDAGGTTPAHLPGAITVGACTIKNRRAYFSNYGAVVDVFAPGLCITSARAGTANEVSFTFSAHGSTLQHSFLDCHL